ncbi:MAG: class I SAM-dependent methyltransferase [Candidatus Pacebacteria bacterium]|jgi:ubiquinone/menaquinone biosynthesis C-methylase UbiE|nr:class I SAM-dependent methyltransferase [Candidatus Paceibacterota bacterium]
MKKEILSKQYNNVAGEFEKVFGKMNEKSVVALNNALATLLTERIKNAIDLGSGLGDMIQYLKSKNITCAGVDSSSEMVEKARLSTNADIRCEDFANTSFESNSFDLITSKWAMQTSKEIAPIYNEASRLLKKNGYFVFLVVHPLRQFLEKKKQGKDYFKKEIVDSIIFDGAITVQEPSHTLMEYLGKGFSKYFSLIDINEGAEFPAAEQIGGDNYPTYLIIVAQKK